MERERETSSPIEPIPAGIANGGCGGTPGRTSLVSLPAALRADSRRSRGRIEPLKSIRSVVQR